MGLCLETCHNLRYPAPNYRPHLEICPRIMPTLSDQRVQGAIRCYWQFHGPPLVGLYINQIPVLPIHLRINAREVAYVSVNSSPRCPSLLQANVAAQNIIALRPRFQFVPLIPPFQTHLSHIVLSSRCYCKPSWPRFMRNTSFTPSFPASDHKPSLSIS